MTEIPERPEEYVPFGDEWAATMMRIRKADLVKLIREMGSEAQARDTRIREQAKEIERLRKLLTEASRYQI